MFSRELQKNPFINANTIVVSQEYIFSVLCVSTQIINPFISSLIMIYSVKYTLYHSFFSPVLLPPGLAQSRAEEVIGLRETRNVTEPSNQKNGTLLLLLMVGYLTNFQNLCKYL